MNMFTERCGKSEWMFSSLRMNQWSPNLMTLSELEDGVNNSWSKLRVGVGRNWDHEEVLSKTIFVFLYFLIF